MKKSISILIMVMALFATSANADFIASDGNGGYFNPSGPNSVSDHNGGYVIVE